ncbi:MAG TPA: hypothetical protein PL045_00165 [Chitinophagaceae bacterium]|nr:hypothetical protein [Chitinophagaceae bacterium]
MKNILILLSFFVSFSAAAQTSYKVTMSGIGPFKINMKSGEVEKLTGSKLAFNNLLKEEWTFDTINISYNGLPLMLVFDKQYDEKNNSQFTLREVASNSVSVATPSGITIGDDKLKIINTYTQYTIWIVPAYVNDYKERSTTNADIMVFGDETGNLIVFHLYMNKVASIGVTYNEGYD